MRTIAVVTVARSDYGIYLPILKKIQADDSLSLHLIVAGAHLTQRFGDTLKEFEADGLPIGSRVEMLLASDSPRAISASMGLGAIGFSEVYDRIRPDLLLVLGDRFEMHAAVIAALPFRLPVAHIHGGELTLGAFDDALRHSITKLSHLHFASTEQNARRIQQMGEEPWRITVSGAPGLDNLGEMKLLDRGEFASQFGIDLAPDCLLVTYHPATLEQEDLEQQFLSFLGALENSGKPILFTLSNADTGGQSINGMIHQFVASHPHAQAVASLGTHGYFSAMALASAMVGNSSSGIIEAASFRLPVVNIGNRQAGRMHGANVLDCGSSEGEIVAAIQKACSEEFKKSLADLSNPYGDGRAAQRIVDRLKTQELGPALILKRFHE